jgi:hypothetical protein
MKAYQFKHQEILLSEQVAGNEGLVDLYQHLLLQLLMRRNISRQRIFEVINLCNFTKTSAPRIVEEMLVEQNLPPFVFLSCNN